jgi:hypothetical protein
MNKEKTYPLIIVFYLDLEMMKQTEIITPFVEGVNNMLHQKNANALAFFLPTTGEERVECISHVTEPLKNDVDKLLNDIKNNFNQ